MTNFSSVGTGAARLQNISPNPQKLAGMCAKLKCCLNYEMPVYEEAVRQMPPRNIPLETKEGTYYQFATDPLKGTVTYSSDQRIPANLQILTPERAKNIIEMNQRGEKPDTLGGKTTTATDIPEIGYQNVVGQDDLTRFDKKRNRGGQSRDNRDRRRDNRENRDNRPRREGRDERGFHPDGERRRDNRPRNNNAPRNNEKNNHSNTPK